MAVEINVLPPPPDSPAITKRGNGNTSTQQPQRLLAVIPAGVGVLRHDRLRQIARLQILLAGAFRHHLVHLFRQRFNRSHSHTSCSRSRSAAAASPPARRPPRCRLLSPFPARWACTPTARNRAPRNPILCRSR